MNMVKFWNEYNLRTGNTVSDRNIRNDKIDEKKDVEKKENKETCKSTSKILSFISKK